MGKNTAIQWTDNGSTWNPWYGCKKVSDGCKFCYMYRDMKRYGNDPFTVKRAQPTTFNAPLHWKESQKVFTCSWSDFFIEEADAWRQEAWSIIKRTPHLTYQILTKRPQNIASRLPLEWPLGFDHVWLGVSVEDQSHIDRIEALAPIPAAVKFVSYEPALGPLDLFNELYLGKINWVISGGESGPKARPADPQWFVRVKNQCELFNVPYFHKQNGGNKHIEGAWGGRRLEGREYNEFPQPGLLIKKSKEAFLS